MHLPSRRRHRAAFSLVELMIAASISAILLLVLVQVLGSSQDLWVSLRKKTDAAQETRSLTGVLQGDLKALFTHGDRNKGLVPFYITPGGTGQPPEISFLAVQELLAQDPTSQSAVAPKSDLCIISYRLDTSTRERPLVRSFSDSNVTYKAVQARIDGFINPLNPTRFPQVPTASERADEIWKNASMPPNSGSSAPEAVSENLGVRIMAFDVVPLRLRRPVATPTGPPLKPYQLQNILTGRVNGTKTDPWPQPHRLPEHAGALPDDAEHDPDYSVPDAIEIRLVVADVIRLASLTDAEIADLGRSVQRDITDGRLDGLDDTAPVLTPVQLRGLHFAATTVSIIHP